MTRVWKCKNSKVSVAVFVQLNHFCRDLLECAMIYYLIPITAYMVYEMHKQNIVGSPGNLMLFPAGSVGKMSRSRKYSQYQKRSREKRLLLLSKWEDVWFKARPAGCVWMFWTKLTRKHQSSSIPTCLRGPFITCMLYSNITINMRLAYECQESCVCLVNEDWIFSLWVLVGCVLVK